MSHRAGFRAGLSLALAVAVPGVASAQSPSPAAPAPVGSTAPSSAPVASTAPSIAPAAGLTWTTATGPADFTGAVPSSIAVAPSGVVVMAGTVQPTAEEPETTALAWVTTDPAAWADASLVGPKKSYANAVAAGDAGFVVVGYSEPPNNASAAAALAWHSADGQTWSEPISLDGGTAAYAVVPFGKGFVAVGTYYGNPIAWRTSNGKRWRAAPMSKDGVFTSLSQVVVLADGSLLVAGQVSPEPNDARPTVWSSKDGKKWKAKQLEVPRPNGAVWGLAVAPAGVAITVAGIDETGAAWTNVLFSPDGATWESVLEVAGALGKTLWADASGFSFIANAARWTSSDGRSWQELPDPALGWVNANDAVALPGGTVALAGVATDLQPLTVRVLVGTP